MDDFLKEALEIVKAQAGVRAMTDDQMLDMVHSLANGLRGSAETAAPTTTEEVVAEVQATPVEGKKSIRERSITCLECGKIFKIISSKHLLTHGLTPNEYRAKWGIKKGTALTCKELQRVRRKKMQDMRLWERRKKANNA